MRNIRFEWEYILVALLAASSVASIVQTVAAVLR